LPVHSFRDRWICRRKKRGHIKTAPEKRRKSMLAMSSISGAAGGDEGSVLGRGWWIQSDGGGGKDVLH